MSELWENMYFPSVVIGIPLVFGCRSGLTAAATFPVARKQMTWSRTVYLVTRLTGDTKQDIYIIAVRKRSVIFSVLLTLLPRMNLLILQS